MFTGAAVILLLSMALPASAQSDNLIINGGFKSSMDGGLTGWLGGNTNAQVTTAEKHSGNASVPFKKNGWKRHYQSCPATQPGRYRLSAYVKAHTPLSSATAAMGIRTINRQRGTGDGHNYRPYLCT